MPKDAHIPSIILLLDLGPSRLLSHEEALDAAEDAFGKIACTLGFHPNCCSFLCATAHSFHRVPLLINYPHPGSDPKSIAENRSRDLRFVN